MSTQDYSTNLYDLDIDPSPLLLGQVLYDGSGSKTGQIGILSRYDDELPNMGLGRYGRVYDELGVEYLVVIVEGVFRYPTGKKGDDITLIGAQLSYPNYEPDYHGRSIANIVGAIDGPGKVVFPYSRPAPTREVLSVVNDDLARFLGFGGGTRLGLLIGPQEILATVRAGADGNFTDHLGVWGSTGAGKSITLIGLIGEFQEAGIATIAIDVDGELTGLDQPADDPNIIRILEARGLTPKGLQDSVVYVPVGRDARNPDAPDLRFFSLRFDELSPYGFMGYLKLTENQEARMWDAYEMANMCLEKFGAPALGIGGYGPSEIIPADLLDRGYPGLTFNVLYDIIEVITRAQVGSTSWTLQAPELQGRLDDIETFIGNANLKKDKTSWQILRSRVSELLRLQIFDVPGALYPDYEAMMKSNAVTVFDLSDSDSPQVNNMIMSILASNVSRIQDKRYSAAVKNGTKLGQVQLILEEAHSLVGRLRSGELDRSTAQMKRIATRGRKRKLGLVLVSHFPEQLDSEFMGLINNHIVHNLPSSESIKTLRYAIPAASETDWARVKAFGKGEALVSFKTQWSTALVLRMHPGRARSMTPNSETAN